MTVEKRSPMRTVTRILSVLLLALVLAHAACLGAEKVRSDHVWTVRTETATPHVPWGRPLQGGPIRTLFIVPYEAGRECVELAQRLEMDVEAWVTYGPESIEVTSSYFRRLAGGTTEERLADLRAKLEREYDLIVVANVKWDMIPAEFRAEIFEQVANGAGLLFVMQRGGNTELRNEIRGRPVDDEGFILSGVPLTLLDEEYSRPIAGMYGHGAGRVVEMAWPAQQHPKVPDHSSSMGLFQCLTPVREMTQERLAVQEYYYAVVARAAMWTARRESDVSLAGWAGQPVEVDQEADAAPVELNLSNAGPESEVTISTRVCDRWGRVESEDNRKLVLHPGKQVVPFDLPRLPVGRHAMDIIARAGEAALDWGTVVLDVKGQVGIKAVRTGEFFRVADRVRVQARLTGDASKADLFRVELLDENGRIVEREDTVLTAGGRILSGEAVIDRWHGPSMSVRSSLLDGGTIRACHEETIFVRHTPEKDFRFIVWGWANPGYVLHMERKTLKRYGFDVFYPYHWINATAEGFSRDITTLWDVRHQARWIARSGMLIAPYAQRDSSSGVDGIRRPCMTTDEFRAKRREKLEPVVKAAAPFGIFFWSMGDESYMDTHEVCFSPTCLDFFRSFLKRHFESVDALNKAWGMDFAAWQDVVPVRRSDKPLAGTLRADLSDGEVAMWVAHRLAMDEVFLETMKLNESIVHEHDPGAHIGIEGLLRSSAWWGYSFEKMFGPYSTLIPADGPSPTRDQVEILRSFRGEDNMTGGVLGGYLWEHRDAINEGIVWNQLFSDADVCFWWYASGAAAALGGDLAPSWLLSRCVEPMRLIRGGLGKLVRHMERLHDGIAILYSRQSVCAAGINDDFARSDEQRKRWGVYSVSASRSSWQVTLEELGLQYEYITGKQAAALDPSGEFKVLVLPYAQAIPKDVAKGIRSFVERGGTVMADVRPGVFDGLGMRLPAGSLDDVFGIARKRDAGAVESASPRVDGSFEELTLKGDLPRVRVDGQVRAKGASVLGSAGEVPVFLVSKFGQGKAVLLNFLMDDLYLRRLDNLEDETVALAGELLAWSGVEPQVKVVTSGKNLKGLEVVRLHEGQTDLIGLMRDGLSIPHPDRQATVGDTVQGTLVFEEARHTYDVRKGAYLGEVENVEFALQRSEALVLARTPYRVSGLSVRPKDAAQGGRATVEFELRGAPDGGLHHLVRIEVTAPDGEARPCMTRKLLVSHGIGDAHIPIAWNDPPGMWTLRVTDVATGVGTEQEFEVCVPKETKVGE